jgi:electron transport complex protein RnfG
MVGFDAEGKILNINVLEQKETPGLGTKMADEGNVLLMSFKDKVAADVNMTVKKDGGDIDALTAATISSRAYAEAVAVAYEAFKVASGQQCEAGQVATGATKQEGGQHE